MNSVSPVKELSVTEQRIRALAELIAAVLPQSEQTAIGWSELTVAAVEHYRANRDQYSQEDSLFVRFGNYFVSPEYIGQHKNEIQESLSHQEIYLSERADRKVYQAASKEDFEKIIAKQFKRTQSAVEGYNRRMDLLQRQQPEIAESIMRFEAVRQIADHQNNGHSNGV